VNKVRGLIAQWRESSASVFVGIRLYLRIKIRLVFFIFGLGAGIRHRTRLLVKT
tara:strand:- start:573 stop:734 length:162 start_codon:yes stop_codon:yes gene_type:complete